LAFAEGLFLYRFQASLSSEVHRFIHFYDALTEFYVLFDLSLYAQEKALPVSAFMKRKTICTWMSGRVRKDSGKEGNSLDIEYMLKLIANNGFLLVLSIYLIWKLESFINEIIQNQKEFSRNVTVEIKEIKQTISDLRVDFAKNQ